ncbi:MAG: hypothetical protein KAW41_05950 [Candidatus Diapherotrites archaeon]|nr:hypothetical protein [Candidatus Diapherotrites archaeon]
MRLLREERAQTSLEYLYLTAFVIGLAAITAVLVTDVMNIQAQARDRVADIRDRLIGKLTD